MVTAQGCHPETLFALPWGFAMLPRLQTLRPVPFCLQLIDRATSPQDEDDIKGDATCLEDSWKELSLLKATPRQQPRSSPAALSHPVLLSAPSLFSPGEWHPSSSNLGGSPFGGHTEEMHAAQALLLTDCDLCETLLPQGCGLPACLMVCFSALLPTTGTCGLWGWYQSRAVALRRWGASEGKTEVQDPTPRSA